MPFLLFSFWLMNVFRPQFIGPLINIHFTIFQPQNAAGTDGSTDPAADTGSANDVLTALSVPTDIDAHLAIGRAIATRNALSAVRSDAKAAEKALLNTQNGRHRASKTAPHPAAKNGIKANTYHTREDGSDKKAVPLTNHVGIDV